MLAGNKDTFTMFLLKELNCTLCRVCAISLNAGELLRITNLVHLIGIYHTRLD